MIITFFKNISFQPTFAFPPGTDPLQQYTYQLAAAAAMNR